MQYLYFLRFAKKNVNKFEQFFKLVTAFLFFDIQVKDTGHFQWIT